jgi:hypothetical protein
MDNINDYIGRLILSAEQGWRKIISESTNFPTTFDEVPDDSSDRRASERTHTIYRLVMILVDGDQGFARCRNISDTGMRLEVAMTVEVGMPIEIRFSPTCSLAGTVAWVDGSSCGIMFGERVNSAQVLRASSADNHAAKSRPLRMAVDLPVKVMADDKWQSAALKNISQRGAKLARCGQLQPGQHVTIALPSGKTRQAVVRWSADGEAGLFLREAFSVEELGSVRAL